jgi:hypothetical protein
MRRIYIAVAGFDLFFTVFTIATHGPAWESAVDAFGFGAMTAFAFMEYWRLRCYELADQLDELLGRTRYRPLIPVDDR